MQSQPVVTGLKRPEYKYDSTYFINFQEQIKFINAEWGVEIELFQ